ncbi:hypothetical protein DY000_02041649 [Brassica cretica]|uniref:Uncharacterized protein n=1 Tax=Brassica cretica TaxID=69181 RepID=A0ABQ7BPM6_BRACR|nr:hypothetical protein DY000_02041649 [Brassica cretica]
MPSSTRSNKDKHLLFSEDPAQLERTIRKDQRSTSLDAAAFTSTDSHTQPSTDTSKDGPKGPKCEFQFPQMRDGPEMIRPQEVSLQLGPECAEMRLQIALKMLKWINLSTIHTCLDCLKEPRLTFNTKPDIIACLGAWYTWDQILQPSLEGQKEVNMVWWQPPLSLDSWKPVQSWSLILQYKQTLTQERN